MKRALMLIAVLGVLPARGDSPRTPKRSESWSENRRFLVEVVPAGIRREELQEAFRSKLDAKEDECNRIERPRKEDAAGRAKLTRCHEALSELRKKANENVETLVTLIELKREQRSRRWSVEVKGYDPAARVSNAGHVVLYGWGNEEKLTVYGPNGRQVAHLGPNEILTPDELEQVPRSASHLNWGGPAGFDLERGELILSLSLGGPRRPTEAPGPVGERRVSLKTGAIVRRP